MLSLPPIALAALSFAVLLLLIHHRAANLGRREAVAFLLSAAAYGWIRSFSIRLLSEARLGSAPYRIGAPLVTIAGVPLQELLGWISAVGLASYLADRLLRRCTGSANACATALAAGLAMAAVCLAVETAAVTAGWWSWSLGHSNSGALRFPAIALLDWGFVALDFLLPYELWRRRAPAGLRFAGLLLFPAHLAGHALTAPLTRLLPFSGFDLVHAGLIAAVAAGAVGSTDRSPWAEAASERRRWQPALAAAILLSTTSLQLLCAGESGLLWTGAPLALAVLASLHSGTPPHREARERRPASRLAGLFLILLAVGLLLRLPSALRAREFEEDLRAGVAALAANDFDGARARLTEALALRPGHSEASWLLGWCEMQTGRFAEARRHLEAAVAERLASREAVRYLALLDIGEGRSADAQALLTLRKSRHRESPDLAYLAWVAEHGVSTEVPAPAELLARATGTELGEIYSLARTLSDRRTMEACHRLEMERTRAAKAPRPD